MKNLLVKPIPQINDFLITQAMRHARVFEHRAVARCCKLRSCTLLVGSGNRMVVGAIAQCKTSTAHRGLAVSLALERGTEQNRRIEHVRVLRDHAIREISALRKTDQHLTEALKSRGVQQFHNAIADCCARVAALADRAAVRVPVVAADVGAFVDAAERQIVRVAGVVGVVGLMCGRGVSGSGVAGNAVGCGVAVGGVAVATIDAVDCVDDADHFGFVVAVPVKTKEQQIVGCGSALLEIDGPRDMQLHGMLLCSPCICHYREWAEFGDAGKATTDDFPCMLAASVLGICI